MYYFQKELTKKARIRIRIQGSSGSGFRFLAGSGFNWIRMDPKHYQYRYLLTAMQFPTTKRIIHYRYTGTGTSIYYTYILYFITVLVLATWLSQRKILHLIPGKSVINFILFKKSNFTEPEPAGSQNEEQKLRRIQKIK